ncbi:MAG: TadE family protein [Planctomycetota bacterium]
MQPQYSITFDKKPTVSHRGPGAAFNTLRPRRRGVAMTETILALPLLMVILALIALFGFAFERYQRTAMATRHAAWTQVLANHPLGDAQSAGSLDPDLDDAFFETDPAESLEWSRRAVVTEANAPLREWAEDLDDDARDYVNRFLDGQPEGVRVGVAVEHASTVPLWDDFMGPLRQTHRLLNGNWRFADGVHDTSDPWDSYYTGPFRRPGEPLAEAFFRDFDDTLQDYADRDNDFADSAIDFYRRTPGYDGPSVIHNGNE